jgi:hypothetical protein
MAQMASQGGVFTCAQARAVGHTESQIQQLRRDRVLVSVRRGVYAWAEAYAGLAASDRHRCHISAVALTMASRTVFSHESAAVLHGMATLDPDLTMVHVTRDMTSGARREAGVDHHVAELPNEHVTRTHSELEVTSPARTAVDVARATERLECAVAAFDSALRLGVTRPELSQVMHRCRSWPGARFVATALSLADGRAANPGESWSRVVLTRQGVPPQDLQVAVYDDEGLIGYADFGWPGVLGEFDGRLKYGIGAEDDPSVAASTLWTEKRREDRLRVGHEVVRWTVADLYDPVRLAARVRAAQGRARERGHPAV